MKAFKCDDCGRAASSNWIDGSHLGFGDVDFCSDACLIRWRVAGLDEPTRQVVFGPILAKESNA